jgi:hypothetical protein
MSSRIGTSLIAVVVAVALACVPAAQAAKPKLFSVSLKGNVRNQVTTVRDDAVERPYGCVGSMSETRRFAASAGLVPKPSAAPVASYGRLVFRARLASPAAASSSETAGSFSPDPDFPPSDPSVCAVAPEKKSFPCRFRTEATRATGAEFALLPNRGRYELYYNRSAGILSCDDDIGESLLGVAAPKLTKLSVRAVKGLARGRSISVSGTVATDARDPSAAGGESLHYTLKVARVR